jgi:FkbM family methyltransferase
MTDVPEDETAFYKPGSTALGEIVHFTNGRYGRFLNLANDGISQMLRIYGEWAQPEVDLLTNLVAPGDTVLDLGANIGTITVPLAKRVGNSGRVVAFEAQPAIYLLLAANLALNELLAVRALNLAVGDQSGFIDVPELDYSQRTNFGGISFADQAIAVQGGASRVACEAIDDLLPDLKSCRLMKIDVEGMEAAVLSGAEGFIRRHRPVIYCEADRRSCFDRIIDFARAKEYRAYWHCFRGYNPNNFFGVVENYYGIGGDVNLLLVPNERDQHITGHIAQEFEEVHRFLPDFILA